MLSPAICIYMMALSSRRDATHPRGLIATHLIRCQATLSSLIATRPMRVVVVRVRVFAVALADAQRGKVTVGLPRNTNDSTWSEVRCTARASLVTSVLALRTATENVAAEKRSHWRRCGIWGSFSSDIRCCCVRGGDRRDVYSSGSCGANMAWVPDVVPKRSGRTVC